MSKHSFQVFIYLRVTRNLHLPVSLMSRSIATANCFVTDPLDGLLVTKYILPRGLNTFLRLSCEI